MNKQDILSIFIDEGLKHKFNTVLLLLGECDSNAERMKVILLSSQIYDFDLIIRKEEIISARVTSVFMKKFDTPKNELCYHSLGVTIDEIVVEIS